MLQLMALEGAASVGTLVTTVTGMAGDMLNTMAENPVLGVVVAIPIAGAIVGLVGRLMHRR